MALQMNEPAPLGRDEYTEFDDTQPENIQDSESNLTVHHCPNSKYIESEVIFSNISQQMRMTA